MKMQWRIYIVKFWTRVPPPPGGPNSFNFMQFLGNFGEIVCWRPPGELAPPPRGNPGSATEMSNRTLVLQGPNILKLLDTNCLPFVDITGPDGLRDHRKRVYHDFDQHVTGIGATSSESSSAVSYFVPRVA